MQQRPSIVIKPDLFTRYEDWEQYISHYDDCAELGQWTGKEMLLTLPARLKGQARVFYSSIQVTAKRDYEHLVDLLEQRFGSTHQQPRWLSGECIDCYAFNEPDRVCRVSVSEKVQIPPQS